MNEPTDKQEWLDYLQAKLDDAKMRESQTVDPLLRDHLRAEMAEILVKIWVMNLDVHKWAQSQHLPLY